MSEDKRLFSQAKGALALREFLQVRTLVPEVSLEIFVCERESTPRLALSFAKKKKKKSRKPPGPGYQLQCDMTTF